MGWFYLPEWLQFGIPSKLGCRAAKVITQVMLYVHSGGQTTDWHTPGAQSSCEINYVRAYMRVMENERHNQHLCTTAPSQKAGHGWRLEGHSRLLPDILPASLCLLQSQLQEPEWPLYSIGEVISLLTAQNPPEASPRKSIPHSLSHGFPGSTWPHCL